MVDFQYNNGLPLEILSRMHTLTFIRFHTKKQTITQTYIMKILQINVIERPDFFRTSELHPHLVS